MELKYLLKKLDIETPEEFEYFENFSDLVEMDSHIDSDALYQLFELANKERLIELVANYFDDIMEAMPDEAIEIYTLLESIKRSLLGLLKTIQKSSDEENLLVHFSEEMQKFHTWYALEMLVECENILSGEKNLVSIRDALALSRLEQLGGEEHRYEFEQATEYDLEEYIMELADVIGEEQLLEDGESDVYDDEYHM